MHNIHIFHNTFMEISLKSDGVSSGIGISALEARTDLAIEAAIAAGELLKRKLTGTRSVKVKGLRDLVTDADVAAQHLILARLQVAFPADVVLSEEGRHDVALTTAAPTWVIDPLDGTSNYAHQIPMFAVSIGLLRHGRPVAGAIYDPLRRELFFAEAGRGAFVRVGRGRPRRLTVSGVDQLSEAMVASGWPREDELRAQAARLLPRVGNASHNLRLTGSAALSLAYLAAGRLDASFHLALQPWDVAAGAALVLEAGGCLSALDGSDWHIAAPQVAASNGRVQAALTQLLAA